MEASEIGLWLTFGPYALVCRWYRSGADVANPPQHEA